MTKSFKTFIKHTAKDYHNQSVNPPIVRASTIIFKSMQDIRKMQEKSKKDPTGGHFDYIHIMVLLFQNFPEKFVMKILNKESLTRLKLMNKLDSKKKSYLNLEIRN